MSIGKYLRNLRKNKGDTSQWSIRAVAKRAGISNAYLSQLENDQVEFPSPWVLKQLSRVLSVDYMTLMETVGYVQEATEKPETVRLPMLGKVPANDIKLVWDDVFDWYEINWDLVKTRNAFILEISGNCLVDEGIHNGNLIIVSKDFDFENGKIYVVRVDGQTSCKKVFKQDHTVILQRANRDMPDPITVDPKRQEFEIIGRVIKSIRSH